MSVSIGMPTSFSFRRNLTMISNKELTQMIKKSYYILLALRSYCTEYEDIEGFLSISYTIDY